MTRRRLDYSDRSRRAEPYAGIDVSTPVPGYYRFRFGLDAPMVGVRIAFAPPLDPVTGEELDRSPRWQAFVNNEYFDDFDRVYPACARQPITETDYRRFCSRLQWAREHAPNSAYADHRRKLDPLSADTPLPF